MGSLADGSSGDASAPRAGAEAPFAGMMAAVRTVLACVHSPPAAENDRLNALALALDTVALACHRTPDVFVDTGCEPPARAPNAYAEMRSAIAEAFPGIGFYAYAWPGENLEKALDTAVTIGDAVDDLADIILDMRDVEWLWQNSVPEDAAWQFLFGYRTHWGRHLHDLRSYLHAKMFGA